MAPTAEALAMEGGGPEFWSPGAKLMLGRYGSLPVLTASEGRHMRSQEQARYQNYLHQ